jgi:mevalonate kinase
MNMTEDQRVQVVRNMTQEEKEFLMNHFSKLNTALDQNISDPMDTNDSKSLIGNFKDSSDGFHKVEGVAKVVDLEDGKTF